MIFRETLFSSSEEKIHIEGRSGLTMLPTPSPRRSVKRAFTTMTRPKANGIDFYLYSFGLVDLE